MTLSLPRPQIRRSLWVGLFFWAALAGPAGTAQQLLLNASLEESGPVPWNHPLYGPGVVRHEFSPSQGIDGTGCLILEGLVPRGRREWYQVVKEGFRPGTAVSAGVQARIQGLEGSFWLEVRAAKGTVVLASATSPRLGPGDQEKGEQWRRLALVLQVPEATEALYVAAVIEGRGKVFLDDFMLVPGQTLPAGPSAPGPEAEASGTPEARARARSRGAVFQVRASVDLRAVEDSRGAQVLLALPAVDEGQCPFYFQVLALPADAIREMRVRHQGGSGSAPHLELKLHQLRSGGRISLDLETRVLLLPLPAPEAVPDSALEAPSWPPQARPYLAQSNLTRSVEAQWASLAEASAGAEGLWSWLSKALGASSTLESPALALAGALRNRGLPARLLSGVVPVAGPTRPVLCVETWLPGPGWVRLLPTPPILAPAPAELLAFRAHPLSAEMRFSRFLEGHPENSFIEPASSIQVQSRLDTAKGMFLECREISSLEQIPEEEIARLRQAVLANWERWLAARARGKGDIEAEFAGQAASQTADLSEMLRFLKKSRP